MNTIAEDNSKRTAANRWTLSYQLDANSAMYGAYRHARDRKTRETTETRLPQNVVNLHDLRRHVTFPATWLVFMNISGLANLHPVWNPTTKSKCLSTLQYLKRLVIITFLYHLWPFSRLVQNGGNNHFHLQLWGGHCDGARPAATDILDFQNFEILTICPLRGGNIHHRANFIKEVKRLRKYGNLNFFSKWRPSAFGPPTMNTWRCLMLCKLWLESMQ